MDNYDLPPLKFLHVSMTFAPNKTESIMALNCKISSD